MSSIPSRRPTAPRSASSPTRARGRDKIRNIYYMNSDGTGRVKIADNGREPCWSPDGTKIAYMKGEFEKFTYSDFATKGLFIYDLKTGKTPPARQQEAAASLHAELVARRQMVRGHGSRRHGLSPHHPGHRGRRREVLRSEARGCRPNISPDGKKVCWGHGDYCAGVAELDFAGPDPEGDQHPSTWSRARTPSRPITSPGRPT